MKSLWQKIVKFFNPTELEKLRRQHNAGRCPKALMGYPCRGSSNYKECL